MGLIHESLPFAAIYDNPQSMIGTVMGTIALGTAAGKAFTIIPQGDVGIRERKGRPLLKEQYQGVSEDDMRNLPIEKVKEGIYQIETKRIVWLVPFIDRIVKVNVTDRTSDPRPFRVESDDNNQFQVDAAYGWYVRKDGDNPFKARYLVNNEKRDANDRDKDRELEQTVVSICNSGLRRVLSGRSTDNLLNLRDEEVEMNTRSVCAEALLNYGVALKAVRIESVARSDSSVLARAIEGDLSPNRLGVIAAAAAAANGGRADLRLVKDDSIPPAA